MHDNLISKDMKLGFIGLGLMGSRFFRRLHAKGWTIRGWNRNQNATIPLKRDGLDIVESLSDLVHGSQLLLSSLANDDAVRAVYLGEDGVFANAQPETIILEMSTISPNVSALLHEQSKKHSTHLIDLPVSGSTPAVEAGTVTLFGGGENEIFNGCIPIFESIASQWYLMGPSTAGIRMKLVVNLLLGVGMEAIAEAVSLGEHLLLNRDVLLDVLPKTAVIAPAFIGKFPRIKSGDYSPQFPLHLMSKDMDLVHTAANGSGAVLPAGEVTKQIFEDALPESGELDMAAITTHLLKLTKQS